MSEEKRELAQGTSGNDTDHIDWDVLAEERLGQRPRTEHGRHIPQTSPAPGDDSGSPSAQCARVWHRKDCPFCGSPDGQYSASTKDIDAAFYCKGCGINAPARTPAASEGAVIAWDCASEEYREGAYKQMALEIQQLRAQLEQLQFGIAAVSFAMGWTDVCGKTNEEFARDLRRERDLALAQVERTSGFTDEQLEDLRAHIRGAQPADTYDYELGSGWRCFHCGETFRTPGGASLHFGKPIDKRPVCLSNPSTVGAPK